MGFLIRVPANTSLHVFQCSRSHTYDYWWMLNGCWENSEKLWGATFLPHPVYDRCKKARKRRSTCAGCIIKNVIVCWSDPTWQSRIRAADAISVLLHAVLVPVQAPRTDEQTPAAAWAWGDRAAVFSVFLQHDTKQSPHSTQTSPTQWDLSAVHCQWLHLCC